MHQPPVRLVEQEESVLDTRTGLVWTKNAGLSEFPMTWSEALAFVNDLNLDAYLGHNNWKLPNRRELFSLMSHHDINPSLPADHPFINVFPGYYWTSTTCARLPDQAWYIHLGGAKVYKGRKQQSYMVWPIRIPDPKRLALLPTGQTLCYDAEGKVISCSGTGQDGAFQTGTLIPQPRFQIKKEGVHDSTTSLTWVKAPNPSHTMVDWNAALAWVEQMNRQNAYGYDDWRLPSIRELEGLTHMGTHTPALPPGHPFTDIQNFYWSATQSMYDTRYAWVLYTRDGYIGVAHKPQAECCIWPLRGP